MKKLSLFLFSAALVLFAAHARDRYVVLAPHALVNDWQAYANERQIAHPELAFEVVDAATVYAAYPVDGSVIRNAAESIHAWIRGQRDLRYLILGGPFLPVNAAAGSILYTNGETMSLDNAIPGIYVQPASDVVASDMFYACTNLVNGQVHPWDSNNNGTYLDSAELADSKNDFLPDIIVSRMPVKPWASSFGAAKGSTQSALIAAYRDKIKRAEASTFDGTGRMFMTIDYVIGDLDMTSNLILRDSHGQFDNAPEMFNPDYLFKAKDSEPIARRRIAEQVAPYWRMREGLAALKYRWSEGFDTEQQVIDAYYAGDFDYCYCDAHGTPSAAAALGAFSFAGATGLTRFVGCYSPCHTGRPDELDSSGHALPSIAEAAVMAPNGGAICMIANTHYGWAAGNFASTLNDGYDSNIATLMHRKLFQERSTVGEAWLYAMNEYAPGRSGGTARFTLVEKTLFGEPLVVFADAPDTPGYVNSYATTVVNASNFTVSDSGTYSGGITMANGGRLVLANANPLYVGGVSQVDTLVMSGTETVLDLGDSAAAGFGAIEFGAGGNGTIRGRRSGQLYGKTPLRINGYNLTLATYDALTIAPNDTRPLAVIENAVLTLQQNPYRGLNGYGEFLAGTVELTNAALCVDGTDDAILGRATRPLALEIAGDVRISARNNGRFTLNGNTTATLANGAKLTLECAFADGGNGGLTLAGNGETCVERADGPVGKLEVAGGKLVLDAIPLTGVTSLVVRAGAELVLPHSADPWYQILPVSGANLTIEDGAIVRDGADLSTVLTGFRAIGGLFTASDSPIIENGAEITVLAGGELDVSTELVYTVESIKGIRYIPLAVASANAGPWLQELRFYRDGGVISTANCTWRESFDGYVQPDKGMYTLASDVKYLFDGRTPAIMDDVSSTGYSWRPVVAADILSAKRCFVELIFPNAEAMPDGYGLASGTYSNTGRNITAWEVQVSPDLQNWYLAGSASAVAAPGNAAWYGGSGSAAGAYSLTAPSQARTVRPIAGAKLVCRMDSDVPGTTATFCKLAAGNYTSDFLRSVTEVRCGDKLIKSYLATCENGKLVITIRAPALKMLIK